MHSTSWKYSTLRKSFIKMDETRNHKIQKRLKYKKGHTEQTNTYSKSAKEALEGSGKYVQS